MAVTFEEILRKAGEVFGVTALRPGQRELIEAAIEGRDALGILPTGGGKSLCYELASLFLPKPVIVVSPLVSLAEDQTDKYRIPVALTEVHLGCTREEQLRWL